MSTTHGEINERFTFHPATHLTGPMHDLVRERHRDLAHWILENVPDSPEREVALRRVQEAMMFSNAAVAIFGAGD